MIRLYLLILFFCSFSSVAFAYLGPGMGGGLIAATLGIIFALIIGLFGLIWFPLKKLHKKRKKKEKLQEKID